MASPSKKQPEAVADKVLKRAEVGKVRDIIIYLPAISTPLLVLPAVQSHTILFYAIHERINVLSCS